MRANSNMKKFFYGMLFLGLLTSCEDIKTGESTKKEMEQTEANQVRLAAAIPPPILHDSLERRNLVKRLERLNKPNQISYIYLISFGKVMAFYAVNGKVSSLNSLLTTPEQVVRVPASGGSSLVTLPSPDFDGSYGKNPDGIFFFEAITDQYVEWTGEFLWSDLPLKLTQPPELVINITEKSSHKDVVEPVVVVGHGITTPPKDALEKKFSK